MSKKRELSKEKMFQKIMPSSVATKPPLPEEENAADAIDTPPPSLEETTLPAAEQPTQQVDTEPAPQAEIETAPQPDFEASAESTAKQPTQQAQPAPQPAQQAPQAEAEPAPQMEVESTAETEPMAEPPASEEHHPINLSEAIVEHYYPVYRQRFNLCSCDDCRDNVLAAALNHLPANYVPHLPPYPAPLASRDEISQAVTELVKAIFAVKKHPQH